MGIMTAYTLYFSTAGQVIGRTDIRAFTYDAMVLKFMKLC